MKHFRVKWGYGRDDFYSIDETELPTALRAQGRGSVAVFREGTIAGNNIIAIMPDYNRFLGYRRDYQLTGEDYDQISRETQREYLAALDDAKIALSTGPLKQLQ